CFSPLKTLWSWAILPKQASNEETGVDAKTLCKFADMRFAELPPATEDFRCYSLRSDNFTQPRNGHFIFRHQELEDADGITFPTFQAISSAILIFAHELSQGFQIL